MKCKACNGEGVLHHERDDSSWTCPQCKGKGIFDARKDKCIQCGSADFFFSGVMGLQRMGWAPTMRICKGCDNITWWKDDLS